MCGISGIISSGQSVTPGVIQDACKVMSHRGPDAQSFWIAENSKIGFGHVRLSIVDPDPRSTQPFSIDNGDYVMVFNGEIYNYLSLRALLEKKYNVQFITTSDTEVLIYLYKHFGKECLQMIEGMFAFVIYDKIKEQVFAARDFIGQKPLVYIENDDGFFFASEIPALFSLCPGFQKKINHDSIKLYLISNFSHLPHHISFFDGVKKLENAGYLIIKDGKVIEKGRYAELKRNTIDPQIDEIGFLDTVLNEMKPNDVKFASFLSGGIDSSYICSTLKKTETKQTEAYTLKISPQDTDFKRSQYVSQKLSLKQHIIELSDFDFLNSINETIKILGEPYFHITSVYADKILQEAQKDHKVFFTGAGGDECYYGYNNILFIIMEYYFRIERFIPMGIKKILNSLSGYKFENIILSKRENFKLNYYEANYNKISLLFKENETPRKILQYITSDISHFIKSNDYRDISYMYGLFLENLHSLTIQGDVIGMKNSIEIRALFLEKRVIERSYSIPFWKKVSIFRLHEGKEILRKGLIKIFGLDFVYAQKIGFGVHYNFKQTFEKEYRDKIYEKIMKLTERDIFEKEEIEKLLAHFIDNFQLIMKLYTIEICLESYYD